MVLIFQKIGVGRPAIERAEEFSFTHTKCVDLLAHIACAVMFGEVLRKKFKVVARDVIELRAGGNFPTIVANPLPPLDNRSC